jgi:hypothetical protein
MKMINVYTCYDSYKRVIGRIKDSDHISKRRYNQLMKKRLVGGTAGIYTEQHDVKVLNSDGSIYCII